VDLHISVIEDVKWIWKELFSNIMIVDRTLSAHRHLFKDKCEYNDKILTNRNWRLFDEKMIHRWRWEYDDMMSEFDGFIVTHTPIFLMLFETYHKPIIVVNSTRYPQPYCWTGNKRMEKMFKESVERLMKKRLLIMVHNNMGDMEYFRKGIGGYGYYIPSLCRYVKATYNPKRGGVLLDDRGNVLEKLGIHLLKKRSGYEWKELFEYDVIVVIPFEISFMTFFEYLQSYIPLILPSKRLLKEWIRNGVMEMGTLKDYNLEKKEDINEWIDMADYYVDERVSKTLCYFDSLNELKELVSRRGEFIKLVEKRRENMMERESEIKMRWERIMYIDYFQFICYNWWACVADFHLDVDYNEYPECCVIYKYKEIDVEKMKENDVIFVKTDLLWLFMERYKERMKCGYRLIIGVSDLCPNIEYIYWLLKDERCHKIACTNMIHIIEHPKFEYIPIGFAEPKRENGDVMFLRRQFLKEGGEKNILLFVRRFSDTNDERGEKYREIKGCKIENIVMEERRVSYRRLHWYLERAKYAICLRGNGIDTHYFYECLLNRCVPIFWNEIPYTLYTRRFKDVSIYIKELGELEDMNLEEFYENIDWEKVKKQLLRESYIHLR